jgi:L,D-peptidoglycan transpeptidase YkuD (ErfK/YbiS/YcfS/YnhG family)
MVWRALLLFLATASWAAGEGIPSDSRQLIVGTAAGWDSSEVVLQRWERDAGGAWQKAGPEWPARLGKNGLAWGRGLHPAQEGLQKKEGDGRAPAGMFKVGGAYGYEKEIVHNPRLPYAQVTELDLWVEDPASPDYNRHIKLSAPPGTEWEKKQQMRLNDPAHSLKLFVEHNAGSDMEPGAGSSIFFHIWRADGGKPTSGCTTMEADRLRELIAWVDPAKDPVYVLLPAAEMQRLKKAWSLP